MSSLTVDKLAALIREVDGDHSLGAGALAEKLLPLLGGVLPPTPSEKAVEAAWKEFERITKSKAPPQSGGYFPSRGAFEFSLKAAYAVEASGVPPKEIPE